jgi:hypothetical protein
VVLAGFKPVAGRRKPAWVGSIPTRLRQREDCLTHLRLYTLSILLNVTAQLCLAQDTRPPTVQPSAPGQTAESNPKAWKEFTSHQGLFSVLLPGIPSQRSQQTPSAAGPLDYITHTLQTDLAVYFIAYVDFPEAPDDVGGIKRALDAGRDGAVATVNGKLISESDILLKGIPGRALTVEGPSELVKARIYMAGLRLYILMMNTNKNQLSVPERDALYNTCVERFLGSFRLLIRKK